MFTDNMTIVVLTSVSGHQRDRGWISLDARRVAMYRDCGTAAWVQVVLLGFQHLLLDWLAMNFARARMLLRYISGLLIVWIASAGAAIAQERGNPVGEWRYWGADAWSTRFVPLEQVDATNFSELEVAWIWRGDNFGPEPEYVRSMRTAAFSPLQGPAGLWQRSTRRQGRRSGPLESLRRRAGSGPSVRTTGKELPTQRSTERASSTSPPLDSSSTR